MNIKAIFLDIDGTLVSFKTHKIPQSTLDAVAAIRSRGIKVFIATGRPILYINNLTGLEHDGMVTATGAYCIDRDGHVIQNRCIPKTDIARVVNYLENHPDERLPIIFISANEMFLSQYIDSLEQIAQFLNIQIPPTREIRSALDMDVLQMITFLPADRQQRFMDELMPESSAMRWHPAFMDVIAKGISKSNGIDAILAKIDSDPESDSIKLTERELWHKIKFKTLQGRRTGVGITAEGDMIAAMGLRYGTDEANDFAENIQKTLAISCYGSSVQMAKERGAFAIYDYKREQNNPFVNRLREADPGLYEEMKKYGRRNIACLTIAPTGTTSIMTQTTSGIEPVFLPVYKRRRKVNPNDAKTNVALVDEVGDSFEEYTVFHHKFITWMKVNGYDPAKEYSQKEIDELVEKSPYFKATANDVDWLQKVHMQGRIQKWVDHSISVTINLPADVSEELVNQLYTEAWKCGCKGCTVYRDGSRTGVLVANDKDKKNEPCNCYPEITPKRPKELDCEVVRFQNNKEKWIAFVGLLNGKPYEIFTGLADDEDGLMLPKSVTNGKIIRNLHEDTTGIKTYDFQFTNKYGYKITIEGLSHKFNPEYWNYAKLISGVLRYGMPIDQVVRLVGSMQLNNESINNWKMGVERALKKYIPEGSDTGQKCPKCGEKLTFAEGCIKCNNCGYSKCG